MKRDKFLLLLLIYLAIGLFFDYNLWKRNAPKGVSYAPTFRFIGAWPYYLFQSNIISGG